MQKKTKHSKKAIEQIRETLKKYYRDMKKNDPDAFQDFRNRTSIGIKKARAKRMRKKT